VTNTIHQYVPWFDIEVYHTQLKETKDSGDKEKEI
jgi:hypothetical protein